LCFLKDTVDEQVLHLIGDKFQKSLVSLELRACSLVDDKGIIGLCERLSGIHELRNGVEPENDQERYQFIYRQKNFVSKNNLEFLNLADLKNIKDASMKSIAHNIFNKLQDLSIWGSYFITNDGFLNLCTAKNSNFKRINHTGCYKISEDSRLWIASNFSRVLIYI